VPNVIQYIIRRLILVVVLLWIVSMVTFGIFFLIPKATGTNPAVLFAGKAPTPDTVKGVEIKFGLDKPLYEQYFAFVGGIFTGREAADQIGGPLRIAQISGQVATLGLIPLIQLSAVLSISIGLLNLFPVPLLDGGHLLFYTVEAVRGRPLSERAQEMGFRIGLGLVLMLMVFATYHDILRLPGS